MTTGDRHEAQASVPQALGDAQRDRRICFWSVVWPPAFGCLIVWPGALLESEPGYDASVARSQTAAGDHFPGCNLPFAEFCAAACSDLPDLNSSEQLNVDTYYSYTLASAYLANIANIANIGANTLGPVVPPR